MYVITTDYIYSMYVLMHELASESVTILCMAEIECMHVSQVLKFSTL